MNPPDPVVIIGAGPAGLTAAYMLSKRGEASTVLEADSVVGGISRTVERDGWRFDIGGHRFFTKVTPVDDLWFEILGEDEFLQRPRMSRILYQGKLYDYPLVPMNALRNLGLVEATRCIGSYAAARVNPPKDQSHFEGFLVSRFGWRLYQHFFKTYTEKLWGVPATEITADFGAQRVKNLSLMRAGIDALTPKKLKQPEGRLAAGHEPDRGVQLPEVRPGPDVGEGRRARQRRGDEDRLRLEGHGRAPARRSRRGGHCGDRRVAGDVRVLERHLVDADGRVAEGNGSTGAARGARGRGRAHVPGLHHGRARRCRRSTRSPTTGSTSTIRVSEWDASRTSARGRRTW